MKKLMYIINPVAGRQMYKQNMADVLRLMHDKGYLPTVYFTRGQNDAKRLVKKKAHKYDMVCCLGGDGTLSEVVNGIMQLEERPPIGYFPLGTANDVATSLNIPKNLPLRAARAAMLGSPTPWDVGKVTGDDYFVYVTAFGAFTDVSYETPQEQKQNLGHLAYMLNAMGSLGNITSYNTKVILDDEQVIEGEFIFGGVTNSYSVAGMIKLPKEYAALDDGKFEVSLLKYPKNFVEFTNMSSDVMSLNQHGEFLSIYQAKKVRFIFDQPVSMTRDGERGGTYQDITIENMRKAIHIIA